MRHLISLLLLVTAGAVYAVGLGPMFFGQPLLGSVLLLAGFALEVWFWMRVRRAA